VRAVRYGAKAQADLREIVSYISNANPTACERLLAEIEAAVSRLAAFPNIGHRRRDVSNKRYRFWNIKPFVVAYRFDDNVLTVVRVVHGARDFRSMF
jgi:addiction module RelE/StbE family toxin